MTAANRLLIKDSLPNSRELPPILSNEPSDVYDRWIILVSVACQSGSRRNLQVVSREVEALFVVRVVPKYNERARTRKRGPLVNLFYFLSMFPKLNKFRLEQNVQVAAKEASNVQVGVIRAVLFRKNLVGGGRTHCCHCLDCVSPMPDPRIEPEGTFYIVGDLQHWVPEEDIRAD